MYIHQYLKFCAKSDDRLMMYYWITTRVFPNVNNILPHKLLKDIYRYEKYILKIYCNKDTYIFTQAQPLRLAHLPPAPSPPSACVCRSCRPFPAARCCWRPSSRRRRPSAARTCGCHPRWGRRRLRRGRERREGGEASVIYIKSVTCNYLCTVQHNTYSIWRSTLIGASVPR